MGKRESALETLTYGVGGGMWMPLQCRWQQCIGTAPLCVLRTGKIPHRTASPELFGDFRQWEFKSICTSWGPILPSPDHGKDCSPSSSEVTPLTHSCETAVSPSLCAVPKSVNPAPASPHRDLPHQPRSWQKKRCAELPIIMEPPGSDTAPVPSATSVETTKKGISFLCDTNA